MTTCIAYPNNSSVLQDCDAKHMFQVWDNQKEEEESTTCSVLVEDFLSAIKNDAKELEDFARSVCFDETNDDDKSLLLGLDFCLEQVGTESTTSSNKRSFQDMSDDDDSDDCLFEPIPIVTSDFTIEDGAGKIPTSVSIPVLSNEEATKRLQSSFSSYFTTNDSEIKTTTTLQTPTWMHSASTPSHVPTCDEDKPSSMDAFAIMSRMQELMLQSTLSQSALQEWDRLNGLPKSHCTTMVNTARSRTQLQKGVVLPKWNGKPLIPGAKVSAKKRRRISDPSHSAASQGHRRMSVGTTNSL
mmetsp:Transcript_21878/g.50468  ORF Transcript_21878/g.50468 Transcript_21878/m.50468 type:complete len:299 (-) Transcript_21878:273-1169(-)